MQKLFVIRHCSATGQDPEAELTADGRLQAIRLADFLSAHDIATVVTSPFLRARQSVEPFARLRVLTPRVDHRLGERVLSKLPLKDWQQALQATFEDFDLSFDRGESSRLAQTRAIAAVEDVAANTDGPIAVVTHGNLLTLLLNHFDPWFGFDAWRLLSNPDVFVVDTSAGGPTVERIWRERG